MSAQKTLKKTELKNNEREALKELKEKILERFPDARIVLYLIMRHSQSMELLCF